MNGDQNEGPNPQPEPRRSGSQGTKATMVFDKKSCKLCFCLDEKKCRCQPDNLLYYYLGKAWAIDIKNNFKEHFCYCQDTVEKYLYLKMKFPFDEIAATTFQL